MWVVRIEVVADIARRHRTAGPAHLHPRLAGHGTRYGPRDGERAVELIPVHSAGDGARGPPRYAAITADLHREGERSEERRVGKECRSRRSGGEWSPDVGRSDRSCGGHRSPTSPRRPSSPSPAPGGTRDPLRTTGWRTRGGIDPSALRR